MNWDETREYILHRIGVSSFSENPKGLFSLSALRVVYKHSGGIPRLVNILCNRALITAYLKNSRKVTAAAVRFSIKEIRGGNPDDSAWRIRLLQLTCLGTLCLVAVFLWGGKGSIWQQVSFDNLWHSAAVHSVVSTEKRLNVANHDVQPKQEEPKAAENHENQPEPVDAKVTGSHEVQSQPAVSKAVGNYEAQPEPDTSKVVGRHEAQPEPLVSTAAGSHEVLSVPEPVRVNGLRYGLYKKKTRIVIDMDSQVLFTHRREAGDRLCIDLDNARVGSSGQKIRLMGKRVIEAETKELSPKSVRAVIQLRPGISYVIFKLEKPYRIVVDVWDSAVKAEG